VSWRHWQDEAGYGRAPAYPSAGGLPEAGRKIVKRSQGWPLHDDTRQYERFRELAKKRFTVQKKELGEKAEEGKGQQQKKGAAT